MIKRLFLFIVVLSLIACSTSAPLQEDLINPFKFTCLHIEKNVVRCENEEVICYTYKNSTSCKWKDESIDYE